MAVRAAGVAVMAPLEWFESPGPLQTTQHLRTTRLTWESLIELSEGTGAQESRTTRMEIPFGQGVYVGDHGTQDNTFIQTYVAHQVIQPPSAHMAGPVATGDVPQQPVAFQARAELTAALRERGPGLSVVRAVTGMRGVGKTQVAAAYARSCIDEGWRLVAWVNAEDLGGTLAGLTAVAAALNLALGEDAEMAGRTVRHWLETDGTQCLLVFDNATDPELLLPFLPAAGAAQVIITSDQQAMVNLGLAVPVDVFSEPEALAFLAERTGLADANGARAVAAELGYLPLALAQAAAVIAGQHLLYDTYLDRLRAMSVGELLQPVQAGQYPRGVAAAVLLSLEVVRAEDDTGVCMAVMHMLAVLSPSGVRRALVHEAGRQGALDIDRQSGALSCEAMDRALARLAGASLLTFSVDGSRVSVHRLVMRVIREQLTGQDSLPAVCVAAGRLLERLAQSIHETWYQDRPAVRDLIEQIMALSESCSGSLADSSLTRNVTQLRSWTVTLLNLLGDSAAQSIQVAESLLADQERVLGVDDPETLRTRGNLSNAYRVAGRMAEALALHEQNLAAFERVLGADHPDTLRTRGNLATSYLEAGRTAEAIALQEQTLADRERVLGPDHLDTLSSRNNLANAYGEAGRTAESIKLLEETLAVRDPVLGPDHPDNLATRNNLAASYLDAGRTAEAIKLLEESLAYLQRVLGPDHPDTLRMRNNLAASYGEMGRAAESIKLFEEILADRERVLGPDHPETLSTRSNLASAYGEAGRTAEAIALQEHTLADQEGVLGPEHPETLRTRSNLAYAYRVAGRTAEAITPQKGSSRTEETESQPLDP